LLYKDEFRRIILEDHPITLESIFSSSDCYQFNEIIRILLSEKENDLTLAKSLTKDFIKMCRSSQNDFHLLRILKPVAKCLITHYFNTTWPSLSKVLLSKKFRDRHNMVLLFGGYNLDNSPDTYILNSVPPEKLIKWAVKNPLNGPEVLIEIIPLTLSRPDNSIEWNPVVLRLLERLIDVRPLLKEMQRMIGYSSWSGSRIPMYEKQNATLNLLKTHTRPEVRQWAVEFIKQNEAEIENKRESEEEGKIGIR